MKKFLTHIRSQKGAPRMDLIEDPVVMEEFLWETFCYLQNQPLHIQELKVAMSNATSTRMSLNKCQGVLRMIRETTAIVQIRDDTDTLRLMTPFSSFGQFRETFYRGVLLEADRAGIFLSDRNVREIVGLGMEPIELPGLVCYQPENLVASTTKELLLGF